MHFSPRVAGSAMESEKEKIKKYKTREKHEIRGNILIFFIMSPPPHQ